MLKFQVLDDQGQPNHQFVLRNHYLLGPDHHPMKGEVAFEPVQGIHCQKRESGPVCLALQHPAGECGELTLQTTLLVDRDEPYLMTLELARHRLMLIYTKFEEWGMFDLSDDHAVVRRVEKARKVFIQAICAGTQAMVEADKLAREALSLAMDASEELALAHAELLLNRRRHQGLLPKSPIGCGIGLDQENDRVRAALANNFDFVALPMTWKLLSSGEDQYRWDLADRWAEWALKTRIPLTAGPIINLDPASLPDWVFMWEHDYETLRDLLYEHIQKVVERYKPAVSSWVVTSGLHINQHITLSFDQIMELTRMAIMLVKKLHPQSRVLVELREPFGEYYATNARSIPPLMYADLLAQSGVNFDALSLRLLMGQAIGGQHTRDLMQFSTLLDQYGAYGKPLAVTIGMPSEAVTEMMIVRPSIPPLSSPPPGPNGSPASGAESHSLMDANCGFWRKPWSQLVQSRWLEAMSYIVLSKPFVESMAWVDLIDHASMTLPLSGLVSEDLQLKGAYRKIVNFRRALMAKSAAASVAGATPPPSANN